MDYEADDETNVSYNTYNRSVRERASDSLHHLHHVLDSPNPVTPPRRGSRRSGGQSPHSPSGRHRSPPGRSPPRGSPHQQTWEAPRPTEHSDYTYGSAFGRLRNLLKKHEQPIRPENPQKSVQFSDKPYVRPSEAASYAPEAFSPSPISPFRSHMPLPRGQIPTQEECVPLLQNQSVLIQQLEAENRFCRDELHVLKLKVREVVEENRLLHDELKRSVIQEILQEGIDVPGIATTISIPTATSAQPSDPKGRPMCREDWGRWQKELERINNLHTAKTSRLEAQLKHAREEVEQYEKEVEDLRKDLRMRDSLSKADPELLGLAAGLCIRCVTNEAVLPPTSHGQSVLTITRERDQLMDQVALLKSRYETSRQREEDMYQQVKKGLEMVEQAQLEETQLIIQRDQLKDQLTAMQDRVTQHAEEVMQKMAQEREIVRKEFKEERDELSLKLKEMQQSLVETQIDLEKVARDKVSLIADLQATRGQVDVCDIDYSKATDTMKMTMTQATLERNAAVDRLTKMRQEYDRLEKDRDQERSRLKQELYELRRRLGEAEKQLVEAKEECIHLTNTTQALERETHLAKVAKESIEKHRSDDLKNISRRAEHRECELNLLLDQMEAKHNSTKSELEGLVNSQGGLVQKLREECRRLAHQLEDITHKYKKDNKKLKSKNDQLTVQVDRTSKRVGEIEEQNMQHGNLQDKMRQRLRQMDDHSNKTTQQVMDLIATESALMRDRQLLAKEVEFLRGSMLQRNDADMALSKLYSSQKGRVDNILLDVISAEQAQMHELISDPPVKDVDFIENELILETQS